MVTPEQFLKNQKNTRFTVGIIWSIGCPCIKLNFLFFVSFVFNYSNLFLEIGIDFFLLCNWLNLFTCIYSHNWGAISWFCCFCRGLKTFSSSSLSFSCLMFKLCYDFCIFMFILYRYNFLNSVIILPFYLEINLSNFAQLRKILLLGLKKKKILEVFNTICSFLLFIFFQLPFLICWWLNGVDGVDFSQLQR